MPPTHIAITSGVEPAGGVQAQNTQEAFWPTCRQR